LPAIQRVGKSGLPTMPWPYLEVGHVVTIEQGPLCGLAGIVLKIKSGVKLVLSVSLLQRSVAVEIDRTWISNTHGAARPSPMQLQANRSMPVPVGPMHTEAANGLLGKTSETD